jgi:hypothetical protein
VFSKSSVEFRRNLSVRLGDERDYGLLQETLRVSTVRLTLGHSTQLSYGSREARPFVSIITHAQTIAACYDIVNNL